MQIKLAYDKLIQPTIEAKYKRIKDANWKLRPGSGIASGEALIVRGGVRQSSSGLVSAGVAPNMAVKFSDLRGGKYHVRIGGGSYNDLSDSARLSNGTNMWEGTHKFENGRQEVHLLPVVVSLGDHVTTSAIRLTPPALGKSDP